MYAREENKNVAGDEYGKYCKAVSNLMSKILTKLFPQQIGLITAGYALLDECEHFEAVINHDPKIFKFVWIYNEFLAWRNWAHDCPHTKTFIMPEHIMPGSVLTFNEGPWRMQQLAAKYGEQGEIFEYSSEGYVIRSFRYNASILLDETCATDQITAS